jgi:hypothetical protein
MKKYLLACLFLFHQHAGAAPLAPSPLAALFSLPLPLDANVSFNMPAQSMIALIGEIDATSVDGVTRILPGAAPPKTLYIDSHGGDIRAAIRLANFVRDHKVRVVVVGRCFSACANYVFSGALSKEVTPGSLVGIHSKQFNYKDGDKFVVLNTSQPREQARILGTPATRKEYNELLGLERAFYAKAGISTRYHDAYTAFDVARGWNKQASPARCRNVDLWLLTRVQLETMGVRGIGAFWAPASAAEARATVVKLGLKENQVFFGSPAELAGLCKPGLLERLRALF